MPLHNRDVAEIFDQVADLLDIGGANQFRIRAYRNAARTVGDLSRNVADMVKQGEDLSELPGIGKDLAGKIAEIVRTGSLKQLQELEEKVAPGLRELMRLGSLGPKRTAQIHKELGIGSLDQLEQAARDQKIRALKGFGEKSERNILQEIERKRASGQAERFLWIEAEEITEPLLAHLRGLAGVKRVTAAGSYRRRRETVGDVDILVTCERVEPVMDSFTGYEDVKRVLSKGSTRSSVVLRSGLQVDLRAVAEESYGAALHYFTGSKAHNVAVRKMGVRRDLKINEYGVFRGERQIAGGTEEEVYSQVELAYIEPELREERGEIEAARERRLPALVSLEQIKGDLQSHTTATDGKLSLEEMAEAARKRGYEYLAISDHSKRVTMARGLDEKRLAEQIEAIERLNAEMKGFRILKSCEVDILEDGSLDLSDHILKELDLVVCATHYNRNLPREKQTERIIRAMDNRYFNILVHPTGRILRERGEIDFDLERVMRAAVERGCYLEVNADPTRLDLNDAACKMAKEMGLKLSIGTDAHSESGLDFMRLGVAQARRGWLEREDVLNTRSWPALSRLLKR